MRDRITVALFWLVCLLLQPLEPAHTADHPNVILMMADDLGWGDTGYNGNRDHQDAEPGRMSREGIRFDRFYAGSSVCSPTRGACLTGRHPYRYGVHIANTGHLREEEICLAEVLKKHGYATGHFGKWHLGTLTPDYSGKGPGRKPRENYSTPGHERLRRVVQHRVRRRHVGSVRSGQLASGQGRHDVRDPVLAQRHRTSPRAR